MHATYSSFGRYRTGSIIVDSTFHHPIFPEGIHPGVNVIPDAYSLDYSFEDGYVDFAELDYFRYMEQE